MKPITARIIRHAQRQATIRQELADERIKFRIYMRVHQSDIVAVMEAWERLHDTEDRVWRAEAATAMYRDQVRRLQRENDMLRAQRVQCDAAQHRRGDMPAGKGCRMSDDKKVGLNLDAYRRWLEDQTPPYQELQERVARLEYTVQLLLGHAKIQAEIRADERRIAELEAALEEADNE